MLFYSHDQICFAAQHFSLFLVGVTFLVAWLLLRQSRVETKIVRVREPGKVIVKEKPIVLDRPVETLRYPRELTDPYIRPRKYDQLDPVRRFDFQKVGFLISEDDSSVRLPLFGKPKYPPRTDKWEYYVQDHTKGRNKIDVFTPNSNELTFGDTLNIDTYPGEHFKAHIYEYNNDYQYNPFTIQ